MNTTHLVMFFLGGATATADAAASPSDGWRLARITRVAEMKKIGNTVTMAKITRVAK